VRVRVAVPEDMSTMWRLLLEFSRFERLEHLATGSHERMAEHLFGRAWPRIDGLIAETASEPAGYAIFYGVYSSFWARPILWLEDLFVRERFRGLGVGRALIAEVARLGVERGCARMDWAVLDWNREAIGFYERLGARRGEGWYTYQLGEERMRALAARPKDGTGSTSSDT
jgi:GNAT superfamily N-acetyltransferase